VVASPDIPPGVGRSLLFRDVENDMLRRTSLLLAAALLAVSSSSACVEPAGLPHSASDDVAALRPMEQAQLVSAVERGTRIDGDVAEGAVPAFASTCFFHDSDGASATLLASEVPGACTRLAVAIDDLAVKLEDLTRRLREGSLSTDEALAAAQAANLASMEPMRDDGSTWSLQVDMTPVLEDGAGAVTTGSLVRSPMLLAGMEVDVSYDAQALRVVQANVDGDAVDAILFGTLTSPAGNYPVIVHVAGEKDTRLEAANAAVEGATLELFTAMTGAAPIGVIRDSEEPPEL
jgi:hypothetical protein